VQGARLSVSRAVTAEKAIRVTVKPPKSTASKGSSVGRVSILTSHGDGCVSVSRACVSRVNRIGNHTSVCRASVNCTSIRSCRGVSRVLKRIQWRLTTWELSEPPYMRPILSTQNRVLLLAGRPRLWQCLWSCYLLEWPVTLREVGAPVSY
jgi:hypothetical protein